MELNWRSRHKSADWWTLEFLLKKPEIHIAKKESIISKFCWPNWMVAHKKIQINPYISLYKTQHQRIKYLYIKPEEKVEIPLNSFTQEKTFWIKHNQHVQKDQQFNQWKLKRLRNFCKAKDTIIQTKQQPTNGKRFSSSNYLIEG